MAVLEDGLKNVSYVLLGLHRSLDTSETIALGLVSTAIRDRVLATYGIAEGPTPLATFLIFFFSASLSRRASSPQEQSNDMTLHVTLLFR